MKMLPNGGPWVKASSPTPVSGSLPDSNSRSLPLAAAGALPRSGAMTTQVTFRVGAGT
jgi:hypothetical protein